MGALGSISIEGLMPVLKAALATQPQADAQGADDATPPAMGTIGAQPDPGALGSITDARPQMPQSILGNLVPSGQQIPSGEVPLANKVASGDKGATNLVNKAEGGDEHAKGKIAYQEHIQDLDDDHRRLDYLAHTGMVTHGQYEEQQGMLTKEKLDYQQQHPWGAPESAHPGVLGKIGHILSTAAQVAGSVIGPGAAVESMIPGSIINRQEQEQRARGQINQGADVIGKEATANAKDTKDDEWTHTGPPMVSDDGSILQPETNKKGEFRMAPLAGGTPQVQAPGAPQQAAPQKGGGALGTIAGAAPAQGALGQVPKFTKLGSTPPGPEKAPVPAEQVKSFREDMKTNYGEDLNDKQIDSLARELGPNPTQADLAKVMTHADSLAGHAETRADTKARNAQAEADKQQARATSAAGKTAAMEGKVEKVWNDSKQEFETVPKADAKGGVDVKEGDINKAETKNQTLYEVQNSKNDYQEALKDMQADAAKTDQNFKPGSIGSMLHLDPKGYLGSHIAGSTVGQLATMSELESDEDAVKLGFGFEGGKINVPTDWLNNPARMKAWESLTPHQQESVSRYATMKSTVITYIKATTGSGRAEEQAMKKEIEAIPKPTDPPEVQKEKMNQLQRRYDGYMKGSWRTSPDATLAKDIRATWD